MSQKILKRTEEWAKRRLLSFLVTFLHARPMPVPSLTGRSAILFLRHDRIGDMIISTGIFRILKQRYPGIRIGVLASSRNAAIVENSPDIDALYVYSKRPIGLLCLIWRIRREQYHFVANLVLYSSLTGSILAALSAGRHAFRIRMTQGDDKDLFFHRNIHKRVWGNATRTMLEEAADILAQLGVSYTEKEIQPVLRLPTKLREKARTWAATLKHGPKIGVNLAAGAPEREAPASLWKNFLEQFAERHPGVQFVLFTPPGGKIFAELSRLGIPPSARENPPHEGIMGVAALLAEMDVVVTTDTSISHLCSALNIPVVVLYHCVENSILWTPYGVLHKKVVSPAGSHAAQNSRSIVAAVEMLLAEKQ